MHVIIVGAGLVGLAIALGLQKKGISYTLIERKHQRGRNWGVTITWSKEGLKRIIPDDVWAGLSQCTPDPTWFDKENKTAHEETIILSDGATGDTLISIPFPGLFRLNVQKTKNWWGKHVKMEHSKNVVKVEMTDKGPAVLCDDGSRVCGTIVIGADGSGSQVRKFLFERKAEPDVLPCQMLNFSIQLPREQSEFLASRVHPVFNVGIHPKGMYMGVFQLDKPDPEDPETWTYYVLASWPDSFKIKGDEGADQLEKLKNRIDGWADPFKSAVDFTPDDQPIFEDHVKTWSPTPWDNHNGQVTIAGDAAHSMTWHRGQGANNGFADAVAFVEAVERVVKGQGSLKENMDMYDNDVLVRGAKEVAISKTQMEASHDHASFKSSPVAHHGVNPVKG